MMGKWLSLKEAVIIALVVGFGAYKYWPGRFQYQTAHSPEYLARLQGQPVAAASPGAAEHELEEMNEYAATRGAKHSPAPESPESNEPLEGVEAEYADEADETEGPELAEADGDAESPAAFATEPGTGPTAATASAGATTADTIRSEAAKTEPAYDGDSDQAKRILWTACNEGYYKACDQLGVKRPR